MVSRRSTIASLGVMLATAVSGCASLTTNTVYETSETATLAPEDFKWYGFSIEQPATVDYSVEVTDGPNIDVLFMGRRSFETYRSGNADQATYVSRLSALDTAAFDAAGEVGPGEYSLTIDNTSQLGAKPPSDSQAAAATLAVDFVVSRPRFG